MKSKRRRIVTLFGFAAGLTSVLKICDEFVSSPTFGHRQQARAVVLQVDVVLVVEVHEAGVAEAGAGRIEALEHEAVDDAVEQRVVEHAAVGQRDHLRGDARHVAFEQLVGKLPEVLHGQHHAAVVRRESAW